MTAASDFTSTTSVEPCTVSSRFISRAWPTATSSFATPDFNPVLCAEMVYPPGFSREKRYCPAPFDTAVRDSFVSEYFRVMVAFGTTAPVESVTVPVTSPVVMV